MEVREKTHGGDVALWVFECSPYLAPDEAVCLWHAAFVVCAACVIAVQTRFCYRALAGSQKVCRSGTVRHEAPSCYRDEHRGKALNLTKDIRCRNLCMLYSRLLGTTSAKAR